MANAISLKTLYIVFYALKFLVSTFAVSTTACGTHAEI